MTVPTKPGLAGEGLWRRLRVARGLAMIEWYERLGERRAAKVFSPSRERALAAAERIPPLQRGGRLSKRSYATYTGGANAVRLARLLALLPSGARILDIGIGFGYVTAMVLRERAPAHYCGIDLKPIFVGAAESMIAANDLDAGNTEFAVMSVFDIDEPFAQRHDPEIVLILEVLEHLTDPAAALNAVSRAVEPGTRVIFTVPLLGRLDGIWGHHSVFDRKRLQSICELGGLRIEHAEPLYNVWSLVVAQVESRSSPFPRRDNTSGYTFVPVPIDGPAESYRRPGDSAVELNTEQAYPRATVDSAQATSGGIRLEMPSPRVARIEFSVAPPGAPRRLTVGAVDETGSPRLHWSAEDRGRILGERRTYVLRPGEPARMLMPRGEGGMENVRWIDIEVEPKEGLNPTLTLHRAAYLPGAGS